MTTSGRAKRPAFSFVAAVLPAVDGGLVEFAGKFNDLDVKSELIADQFARPFVLQFRPAI